MDGIVRDGRACQPQREALGDPVRRLWFSRCQRRRVAATGLLLALWALVVEAVARLLAPAAHRRFPALAALLLVRPWADRRPAEGTTPSSEGAPQAPATASLEPPESSGIVGNALAPPLPSALLPAPALTETQRKRLTFWGVLVGGLLALGLVTLLVFRWLGSAFFGPAPLVEQYLADLTAGDGAAASALADPGVPNALRVGLTNPVLAGASARLDSVIVGEPVINESSATIPVQYSVDGQKVTASLTAERTGSAFVVFPTWRLTSSLAQAVSISSAVGVNVAGTDIAAPGSDSVDSGSRTTTYLYPGSYSVTGAKSGPATKWLTPTVAPVTVTAPGSLPKTVSITATPSQALVDEVNAQVKALVDSCSASGAASPKSALGECPFSTYSSDGKATWKVVSYPQLKVEFSSFSQALYASAEKSGSVQVTTDNAFFGPSTNTTTISVYSLKVNVGADGAVHLVK